jgi:autotransporter-associated beta strand protein
MVFRIRLAVLSALVPVSLQAQTASFSTISTSGYATADTNSCATGRNNLVTSGNYQFAAFYDNQRYVNIARRNLGSTTWTNVRTTLRASTTEIADDHNNIALAVDGDGYLHCSWGMHNVQMRYARTTSVATTGTWNTTRAALTTPNSITGANENSVTYPEFFNVPSSKDLLLIHRNGSSGNGNEYISRYSASTQSWTRLQPTLMDGISTSVNGYLNNLQYTASGKLMMTWVWRGTPAFQSNHNILYAESLDNGVTWQKQGGAAQTLPLNEGNAQVVKTIPTNSSLINQSTMTADVNGNPMVATWYAPNASSGDNSRQYMLEYYDGSIWRSSQITNRQENRGTSLVADTEVRETGRPIVIVDQSNRVLVIMRQDEDANRIVAAYSSDRQNWSFVTLNSEDMGTYEPTYDRILWERDHVLNLFYQPVGLGSATSTVQVLEWDVAGFFAPLAGTYWTLDGNGNWDTAANWNGAVPNAASAIARYGGGTTSISTNPAITIDGTKTLGTMSFNHPSSSFSLVSGIDGAISLNNGAAAAFVSVQDGNHAINVPVTIGSAGAEFSITGATDSLSLGSTLSGTGTITKSGLGVLAFASAGNTAISNSINITGGLLRQDGAGVLTLAGSNSFAGGGVAASAGTLRRGNAAAFANGMSIATSGSGKIDLNGYDLTIGSLSGSGGSITDDSATGGTTRITFYGTSTYDYSGSISNGAVRSLAITKTGTSTLRLRGASSFTGGINLDQGFIEAYHNNALGTGTVTMNPGATNARLVLGDGITVNAPVVMTTANAAVLTGSIMTISDTSSGTYSGALTINGNASSGGHFMGPRTSGLLRITGPITTGPSVATLINREGFVRFSGGGSYPGLDIRASTTSIGANNGIATNAVVDIGGNGSTTVATVLDLNGFSQTLAGLKNSVTSANAALVTNTSATMSTLTLSTGAASQSFGGSISGNLSLRIVSGRQILTRSGTTTLNGVYDYVRPTIVDGGALQLTSVAWNPVLNLTGAEVNGGELIFDYTGTTSPKTTILPLLSNAMPSNFTNGKLRRAVPLADTGLAFLDDGVSLFTVKSALYGDASLDGRVNTFDFNQLAGNWGASNDWTKGNFNYDSTINSIDFNLLVSNFGKAWSAPAPDLGAVVPEPSAIAVVCLGIGILARRGRQRL